MTPPGADPSAFVRRAGDGGRSLSLLVDGVHCMRCIATVEGAMRAVPGVVDARVNLGARRLALTWRDGEADPAELVSRLGELGYPATPCDPEAPARRGGGEEALLLRSLAVAGFAAGNVMLLSVAVWAGAFSDMAASTRTLMHWLSALVALPAIAYAGRPFYRSAARALAARRVNMDVPISVAVAVTAGVSLASVDGPHAYFDAAVMLLFFLLIGRYLDRRTRGAARSAAEDLAALAAQPALVLGPGGGRKLVPARAVAPGAAVLVAAGQRFPVDGVVLEGETRVDRGLLTGESLPEAAGPGDGVLAGTVNAGDPVTVRATAAGEGTVLNEVVRLAEAAGQARSAHVRLADRAARLYAPVVHSLAAAAFLGWWLLGGMAAWDALLVGVAVLIITCPCALGLAVPAAQVAACNRLLRSGVLVKSGDALERLAAVDTAVLDKTGTLTLGRPEVAGPVPEGALSEAASLAAASRHPLCQAVVRAAGPAPVRAGVRERPAMGLAAGSGDGEVRLGSRAWCGPPEGAPDGPADGGEGPELWLRRAGGEAVRIRFSDRLRPDARAFVAWLRGRGIEAEVLSGDHGGAVRAVAGEVGAGSWRAGVGPAEKLSRVEALGRAGRRVLMVGDGLNDAPSLAAAHVSVSPAEGADIAQNAADIVFQGERLESVAVAMETARRARRVVLQNFALAAGYNALAVPLAVAGLVTPLVAAAAMSASSVLVTLNALRLLRRGGRPFG